MKHAAHSLSETARVLFLFLSSWRLVTAGDRVIGHLCAGGEPFTPHEGSGRITYMAVFMVRPPTRQLHSTPIAVSESGATGK